MDIQECTDLSSDHTPVILSLICIHILVDPPQRLYCHRTNWEKYKRKISEGTNLDVPLNSPESVEIAIETLNKLIHQAANESKPISRPRLK